MNIYINGIKDKNKFKSCINESLLMMKLLHQLQQTYGLRIGKWKSTSERLTSMADLIARSMGCHEWNSGCESKAGLF
jgi:hypothetical protein